MPHKKFAEGWGGKVRRIGGGGRVAWVGVESAGEGGGGKIEVRGEEATWAQTFATCNSSMPEQGHLGPNMCKMQRFDVQNTPPGPKHSQRDEYV